MLIAFIANSFTVSSGAIDVYQAFIAANGNNAVAGISSSSYLYPYAMAANDVIDGNKSFQGGSAFQTLAWNTFYSTASTPVGYYGNFVAGGNEGYIGLRLDVNGTTHYGWVRIEVEFGEITIKDYAYEQTACLGIEAGATTGGLTAAAAPAANNIVGTDNGNTGTGADLNFSFDVASSEDGVSEYRTFAVKAGSAFDLAAAQAVATGSYVSSTPNGAAITGSFDGTTDTDGDAIAIWTDYDLYVLSVNDCANAQSDALAVSTESVQITPPVGLDEVNEFGYNVYTNGNTLFVNTNTVITSLTVTSIDGKMVFNKTNVNGNQQIDMNSASGIYLVNIQTAQGVFSEKVLLK